MIQSSNNYKFIFYMNVPNIFKLIATLLKTVMEPSCFIYPFLTVFGNLVINKLYRFISWRQSINIFNKHKFVGSSHVAIQKNKWYPYCKCVSCEWLYTFSYDVFQVLVRYSLHKLFGPGIIGFTDDDTALYLDLPSNVVSLFLNVPTNITMIFNILRVAEFPYEVQVHNKRKNKNITYKESEKIIVKIKLCINYMRNKFGDLYS